MVRNLLACLTLAVCACAQKVPDAVLHKPTPIPDRIILTWVDTPSSSQAVNWRTDTTVTKAYGEITASIPAPTFNKTVQRVDATTTPFTSDLGDAHYHSLNFTGLTPDTVYVYRVGDGTNFSEWNQFRTPAATAAPLEFIYVGDAQNDIWQFWSRTIRQSVLEAPKARFIIHAGDLINTAKKDADWGEWFAAPGWINRSIPSLPAAGNHEYFSKAITPHWRAQFNLPSNGVPGLEESNYYLDIQGVRFVVLNSNEKHAEQAAWLDQLLAKNPNRWTLLTFHHPIYSTATGRDNKELRELWQPIFDKYKVDLVMTGHDHTYGRTNLATGTKAQAGSAGTVYVVSVSGPKMYKVDQKPEFVKTAQDTQLYQVIRIDRDKLSYEARTATGTLYDAFELQKQPNKPNKLTERKP
jgi:hypothetical protein